MGNGIYTALAGAVAQGTALDVTAENVANASTAGYRGGRVRFDQVLSRATDPSQAFAGIKSGSTDETMGAVTSTGNPLDLALSGEGWFGVEAPGGTRYTRAGSFSLDAQRRLVTSDGSLVRGSDPANRRLVVPPAAVSVQVGADGTVTADGEELGKIEIVRFAKGSLLREGATTFIATTPPTKDAPPTVLSGHLEQGNVNAVRGMVDLVRTSRTYEALHRMIESYKSTDERAARAIGNGGH